MSQVLEKPILLDETGQDISSKINGVGGKIDSSGAAIVDVLEDIKDAIGVSGDFTPVMIKVTTPPAKIAYMAGEPLDLAGIVVSLIAANGVHIDVTDQCTFNPANGTTLTSADTSVTISYYWYKDDVTFTTTFPIGIKELDYITITTPPTQIEYVTGDTLDLTGIVVVATYDDGTFLDVTANCTFSPADGATLTASDTTITVSYTEAGTTKTATQNISVTPIYGATWDGTATQSWTRTESAANFTDPVPAVNNGNGSSPFDNIMPWSGIEKVTDSDAGALVKIPKYWYKWTPLDNNGIKIQIANEPLEGFLVSPAHMERGDNKGEKDYVYVGAYLCDSTNKSVSGVTPVYKDRGTWNTDITALGTDIYPWDYAMFITIAMLYLVEFASWDSSNKIGWGNNTAWSTTGGCDAMRYHTGTKASRRGAYGYTRYRYIEDLWGNGPAVFAGVLTNPTSMANDNYVSVKVTLNPNNFSQAESGSAQTITNNWFSAGSLGYSNMFNNSVYTAYIKRYSGTARPTGYEWARFPVRQNGDDSGSSASYVGDESYINKGTWGTYQTYGIGTTTNGLFAFRAGGNSNEGGGSRLMKLPSNS